VKPSRRLRSRPRLMPGSVESAHRESQGTGLVNAAPLFAALGDKTRLHIVSKLCNSGPSSIVQLTEYSAVSRQAISKHLLALEEVGLVGSGRAGRERIWELRTESLAEARHYLSQISEQWNVALGRLRDFVDGAE
jgi:DNA-binding transcriptional ArsR family regulator